MGQRIPRYERVQRTLVKLLGFAMLLMLAFGAGVLYENEKTPHVNHAGHALKKCNLTQTYAPSFCLRGFTGFRDTYEQIVFAVDEKLRPALMQEISRATGWTAQAVTAEDFRAFSKACWYKEFPPLPDDMVFDAWFYRETHEPTDYAHIATGSLSSIGAIGYGFEFAVFDMETGLMIFIDQFG